MDDLISRQAVIKAIPKRKKGLGGESWMMTYRRSGYNDCVDACLDAIRKLPSAQSERERKRGKWRVYEGEMTCSCCETTFYTDMCEYIDGNVPKFCPWCGADMRGDGYDN